LSYTVGGAARSVANRRGSQGYGPDFAGSKPRRRERLGDRALRYDDQFRTLKSGTPQATYPRRPDVDEINRVPKLSEPDPFTTGIAGWVNRKSNGYADIRSFVLSLNASAFSENILAMSRDAKALPGLQLARWFVRIARALRKRSDRPPSSASTSGPQDVLATIGPPFLSPPTILPSIHVGDGTNNAVVSGEAQH
jgi:hypothetical protein